MNADPLDNNVTRALEDFYAMVDSVNAYLKGIAVKANKAARARAAQPDVPLPPRLVRVRRQHPGSAEGNNRMNEFTRRSE